MNWKHISRLAFVFSYVAWSVARIGFSQQVPEKVEFAGQGMPLAERVGTDDGVAFVVHFGGDIHGNLDACG
jgi:hypothetical protein